MRNLPQSLLLALSLSLAGPLHAAAANGDPLLEDLTDKSLEELMQIEITVTSKSAQKLDEVPAAVYVITGDEIRRAGHSSLPEALRMVPGFYVSHWASDAWDVTSRGFGPGLSLTSLAYLNQLLVMIDGVVVYSPLFAGTWWPLAEVDLGDIDRIEIVRGPGGILWGSNAVHGVVHIITKNASETTGLRTSLHAAVDDRHVSGRVGGAFGENGYYRGWIKRSEYDTPSNPYLGFDEDWGITTGGIRADWSKDGKDYSFLLRGYNGRFDYAAFDLTFFFPYKDTSTKNGLQLFGSVRDPDSGVEVRAWYTHDRQDLPTLIDLQIDTADLEVNKTIDVGDSTSLLVGAGYRTIRSDLKGDDPVYLMFDPERYRQNIFRAFAVGTRDVSETVKLTAGLTVEHNDFTQFEVQPTARATWAPSSEWMAWASVSRAVRTPSLEERFLDENSFYVGSDDFRSETLWAYELGARHMFGERVSTDLALFYNQYDHLHYEEFNGTGYDLTNDAEGDAWGAELAVDVQPFDWWRLRSAFAILHGDHEVDGVEIDTDDYHPEQQFNLRSYIDLGEHWELDAAVYDVSKMGSDYEVAEYTRVDVRLGWNPTDSLKIYVGGQDVGNETRSEYSTLDNTRRTMTFGLSWEPR